MVDEEDKFKAAFISRFQREPSSERDFKILPMVYFQQQVLEREAKPVAKALIVQACYSRTTQRSRKQQSSKLPRVCQSPVVSILRSRSTPSRSGNKVRWIIPEDQNNELTIDKQREKWKASQLRLEQRLVVFKDRFQQLNGRDPVEIDWQPVLRLQKRYTKVQMYLARLDQLQANSVMLSKKSEDTANARSTAILGQHTLSDETNSPKKKHGDGSPKILMSNDMRTFSTPTLTPPKRNECGKFSPITPQSRLWNLPKWTHHGGHHSPNRLL